MPEPAKLQILVELRKAAHLSQKQVAQRFGLEPEQGRKTVGNWEIGIHPPDKSRRQQFIGYLWDALGLRHDPQRFEQVWSLLVAEW
jgi:transcriptional regulator with XRE-family HTH domain